LNYNENKVRNNNASLIHAGNFLGETSDLDFYQKKKIFQNRNDLNLRSKVNMLHVSLNFDPSEIFSNQKLSVIADAYMEGIGFAEQPYLVYKHEDAGHPHIHIVSSLITANGKRIRTQNLGRNQSEKTRKEIEREFHLIKADGRRTLEHLAAPLNAKKILYGKPFRTKQAMQNVLQYVLKEYTFTSLPELNAILRLYNMHADRGSKNSRVFKSGGLVYRVLDENKNKAGVPIKASDFYFKPTLSSLFAKFESNKLLHEKFYGAVKSRIDWVLMSQPKSIESFINDLKEQQIELVIRQNDQRIIYGLTYVDLKTKSVFNGSDFGKNYSAKGILSQFEKDTTRQNEVAESKKDLSDTTNSRNSNNNFFQSDFIEMPSSSIISELLKPEEQHDNLPYELRKKRKKRKRR